MFADVVITKSAYELDRLFCYKVPAELEAMIAPGMRVLVPFGRIKAEGIIIRTYSSAPEISNIKSLSELIDDKPVITETGFKIAEFIRKKYLSSYYYSLKLNMPSGLKLLINEKVFLKKFECDKLSPKQEKIVSFLFKYNGCTVKAMAEALRFPDLRAQLSSLNEEGIIEIKNDLKESIKDKTATVISLLADRDEVIRYIEKNQRNKAQIRVLTLLMERKSITLSDLREYSGAASSVIKALINYGLIESEEVEVLRNPFKNKISEKEEKLAPTDEQRAAIDTILSGSDSTYLLHGVTGSGKTEVYLQVIEEILKDGRNAIVLVPEISLTPLMVSRFFKRFGDTVAVIHSGLSKEERYDQFKMIRNGDIKVVIGARSAIFAPIENVGIIVIDEEHESSYKSDVHPKYDTLEIAKVRCDFEKAKLILASATPSIVSYYRAKQGIYKLIKLNSRTNNMAMPDVSVVDMREEIKEGNFSPLSRLLKSELEANIQNKEQSILFLNRRGYATFISCRSCGYVAKCPECDVSLTYHSNKNKLVCHYCGYEQSYITECPQCKSKYIKHFGKGTQKIEEELKEQFEGITILRMDTDTTYKKFSHEKIFDRFDKENINVLLGTQMITKGLDFKNVTLAAVLAADGGLYLDDFRSTERTFNQITQVIGRAGRGEIKGRGIIQTYSPEHYVIELAKNGNYEEFYNSEIELRRQMNFPPFCDMINIVCQSENHELCKKLIKEIYKRLTEDKIKLSISDDEMKVYKPNYAPVPKIKNKYRMRILIKSKNSDDLLNIMESIYAGYNKNYKIKDISLSIDINPINML